MSFDSDGRRGGGVRSEQAGTPSRLVKEIGGATLCLCATVTTVFLSAEGGGIAWGGGGGVSWEVDVVLVVQARSARHRET